MTAGELDISATWDPVLGSEAFRVPGADTYRVEWRPFADNFFLAGNVVSVATTSAEITVSGYGKWVVRVRGCNQFGCGPGATQAVDVKESE